MKLKFAFVAILFFITAGSFSQPLSRKLKFSQGQELEIFMNVQTKIVQEAMGQSVDYNVDGLATHKYTVTNTTDDNSTLHHTMKRFFYSLEGFGPKQTFDSDKPKDMEGKLAKPIKELLGKTYDMVIDSTGRVMVVVPEKIETNYSDALLAMIMNLLKDLAGTVQPPKKNDASFFKVLPDTVAGLGDSWTETVNNEGGKSSTVYKITGINDSTVIVDFTGNSMTTSKAEMMGMETTTTMNNKYIGKIILDKTTGIMRQKSSTTDSHGNTEVMGGMLPVTSKTTTVIDVVPKL